MCSFLKDVFIYIGKTDPYREGDTESKMLHPLGYSVNGHNG